MIGRLFGDHAVIGIDSNVLIYLLEGSSALADRAAGVIDAIQSGAPRGVMSSLALAEVCSGPARGGDIALAERFADEIRSIENLAVVALAADIAVDAALLRGSSKLGLADSIHLASARVAGASVFVTNDRRLKSVTNLRVEYLANIKT